MLTHLVALKNCSQINSISVCNWTSLCLLLVFPFNYLIEGFFLKEEMAFFEGGDGILHDESQDPAPPTRIYLRFVFVSAFVFVSDSIVVVGEGGVGCCIDCQS